MMYFSARFVIVRVPPGDIRKSDPICESGSAGFTEATSNVGGPAADCPNAIHDATKRQRAPANARVILRSFSCRTLGGAISLKATFARQNAEVFTPPLGRPVAKPPNDPNQAADRASCGAISGNIGNSTAGLGSGSRTFAVCAFCVRVAGK